jgi:hypothetical protein
MLGTAPVLAQPHAADTYRLALPDHNGQLQWSIGGFKFIENSAKPNGQEIGLRGRDASGRLCGISGDLAKARRIFEEGTAQDLDYAMNYYNLACADAGENKLAEARPSPTSVRPQSQREPWRGSARPTQDGSFLPFKNNQEFWMFLELLQAGRWCSAAQSCME